MNAVLLGSTCQSGQQGQCREWWCTISRESSQLRRIFVLDTENLCSISISEEMGPGEACVVSHLSWVAVPRHWHLFTALRCRLLMQSPCISPFHTNPILKYSVAFHVVDFCLKRSWLFYFATLMEVHPGVGECWGICNSYFPAWLH